MFENHLRKSHFAICELHFHINLSIFGAKIQILSYKKCLNFVNFWHEIFEYFHIKKWSNAVFFCRENSNIFISKRVEF